MLCESQKQGNDTIIEVKQVDDKAEEEKRETDAMSEETEEAAPTIQIKNLRELKSCV